MNQILAFSPVYCEFQPFLDNFRQVDGVTVTWRKTNFDILDLLFDKEHFGGKNRFLVGMDQTLAFSSICFQFQ